MQYDRDALGRITSKTETISGITDVYDYRYDLAGRLDQVKKNNTVTAQYQFDPNAVCATRCPPNVVAKAACFSGCSALYIGCRMRPDAVD